MGDDPLVGLGIGENSIALKHDAATRHLERYREKMQSMEQEAVERRLAEQDDMYKGESLSFRQSGLS